VPTSFEQGVRRVKRKDARRGATMKITTPTKNGAAPEVPVGHRHDRSSAGTLCEASLRTWRGSRFLLGVGSEEPYSSL
jgi:hypothetical protein